MTDNQPSGALVPASTRQEVGLDIAAVVTSVVPWLGGPVSVVLGGMAAGRRYKRVSEALGGLAKDLKNFKNEASELYVKTEDFEDLLGKTLWEVAEERHEEKRRVYRAFLLDLITSPGQPYDDQVRVLRTLELLQPDHFRILKVLRAQPEGGNGITGSPLQTLRGRLPSMQETLISDLVEQLNDLRVTSMTSLRTMMTFGGAQDLRHSITKYGERFLAYVLKADELESSAA